MTRKKPAKVYLIAALLISSIVFIAGLSVGLMIDDLKTETLQTELDEMKDSLRDAEAELLIMDFFEDDISCDYLLLKSAELSSQSEDKGKQLELIESSNPIGSESYLELKKDYMRVLINNWVTLERIKAQCNANYTTVLYFYGEDAVCGDCEEQAYVLDYYKNQLGNDFLVFALDTTLNLSVINLLSYNYGVVEFPSLVINDELFSGYQNLTIISDVIN